MVRNCVEQISLDKPDHRVVRAAHARGVLRNSIQHRLNIRR